MDHLNLIGHVGWRKGGGDNSVIGRKRDIRALEYEELRNFQRKAVSIRKE